MSVEMEKYDFNEDIRQAVDTLRRGGVILYPTDTVWGIGCDATNADAVARIYALKHRDDHKAMIALVDSVDMLWRHVECLPDVAEELIEAAVDPLTVVYDHGRGLAQNLTGPDGSIGIRVTRERYSAELCRRLRRPVVSTSANIAGHPTPACFAQIDSHVISAVDYVAGYRREDNEPHKPSSVIKLGDDGTVKILRN